jgi:hypothetical protein
MKKTVITPRPAWNFRPATDNQIFTLHKLSAFAKGEIPLKTVDINPNLTMLQVHQLINAALDQIETNIQVGGTVINRILSREEWMKIQEEVTSGDIYREGLSEKEWDDLQKEIYDDLDTGKIDLKKSCKDITLDEMERENFLKKIKTSLGGRKYINLEDL